MPLRRFQALDSWRGICALLVALHHFPAIFYFSELPLIRGGGRFVDFFFVLSGFVITHGYGHRINNLSEAAGFFKKRFFRLYPLHLFTFLLFVALIVCFDTARIALATRVGGFNLTNLYADMSVEKIAAHIALLQGFLGGWESVGFNVPSWSISVEFWTYIVFGVCCLIARKSLLASQLTLLAISLGLPYLLSDSQSIFYINALRSVAGFSTGSICYLVLKRIDATPLPRPLMTALEIASLLLVAAFMFLLPADETAPPDAGALWLAPLVFVHVVAIFSYEGGYLSDILKRPLFRTAGAYSYSIYMDHAIIISLMKISLDAIGRMTGFTIDAPSLIGSVLVMAFVYGLWKVSKWTYEHIELPGQQLSLLGLARTRQKL